MTMFSRSSLALLVLGVLAAAVAVDMSRDEGVAPDAPRAGRGTAPATGDASIDMAGRLRRERLSADVIGEPFAGREAPRAAAAAPVPAGPPPFPYRYAGQFRIDDGGWRVYLLKGNELVLIKVGDVLEGAFKVTAIGAEEFEIVHLPSATTRVLQYASLGTGSALAQSEPLPSTAHARTAVSGTSDLPVTRAASAAASASASAGMTSQGAAIVGAPGFAGTPPASPAPSSTTSSGSVTSGSVPRGQLGTSGPAAGAPRLGVAPPASNSMPMSPAPSGTMQTLPAPTGRLGV